MVCPRDQEGKFYGQRVTRAKQRPRLSKSRTSIRLAFPPTLRATYMIPGRTQSGACKDRPETPNGKSRTNVTSVRKVSTPSPSSSSPKRFSLVRNDKQNFAAPMGPLCCTLPETAIVQHPHPESARKERRVSWSLVLVSLGYQRREHRHANEKNSP